MTRKDRKYLVITDYPLTLVKPNGLFLKIKKDKKMGIEKCLVTTVFSLLQLLLMDSTVIATAAHFFGLTLSFTIMHHHAKPNYIQLSNSYLLNKA